MPIVKVAIAVEQIEQGGVIVVEATDPAFEMDIRAWAEMTGDSLEAFESGDVQCARIRAA